MNGVVLQDSGRSGKRIWAIDLIQRALAGGIILTPFATPPARAPRRVSAQELVHEVHDEGGDAVFDPMTHCAILPSTNQWEIYDDWDLWSGPRGDLGTRDKRNDHVLRVLGAQVALGTQPLAPTLSLASSAGTDAERSLEMASTARSQGDAVALAIVGTSSFWAQGVALDDHVGQIAQLRPARAYLSVMRQDLGYPPQLTAAEVEGISRTTTALARRCDVVVQYSDFFGLPAVAAGASAIGSGWDLRQRLLAPDAFRTTTQIRRTANRISYAGLLSVLKRVEAERLLRTDRARSLRLVPGTLPANGNALWDHHLTVLADQVRRMLAIVTARDRTADLSGQYTLALAEFNAVEVRARPLEAGPARWLGGVADGLDRYAAAEGW